MLKRIKEGFLFGLGLFLFIGLIFSVVFAIGFHSAEEILGGTFNGDYVFNGNAFVVNKGYVYLPSSSSGNPTIFNYSGDGKNYIRGPVRFDTASLIYSSGSFQVGGGLSTMYVNASNTRVGIGTKSPQSKLDVNGTIRAIEICDENGLNCNDISAGFGSGVNIVENSSQQLLRIGDLQIIWGYLNFAAGGNQDVTFSYSFTEVPRVIAGSNGRSSYVCATGVSNIDYTTTTGTRIYTDASNKCTWMAIGKWQ